jgi:hypothetical protein
MRDLVSMLIDVPVALCSSCWSVLFFLSFSQRHDIGLAYYFAMSLIVGSTVYIAVRRKRLRQLQRQNATQTNHSTLFKAIDGLVAIFLKSILLGAILVVLYGEIGLAMDRNNQIETPIVAEAFHWPAACERHLYRPHSEINRTCRVDKYFMGSSAKFGFRRTGRSPDYYYRVGNDAISFYCTGSAAQETCRVDAIQEHAFIVIGPADPIVAPASQPLIIPQVQRLSDKMRV